MPGTLQLKLRNTLWTELSAGRRRGLTCKNPAVTSEPLLFNYFVSPPSLSVFPLQRWPALSREAAPIISTALSFLALWPYPNPLRWLLLIPTNSRRTGQTEGGRGGCGCWWQRAGTERQTGSSNVASILIGLPNISQWNQSRARTQPFPLYPSMYFTFYITPKAI